jgi:hypothetical protein
VETFWATEDAKYLRSAAVSQGLIYMLGEGHGLLHVMKTSADKLEALTHQRDELLQAHTALVARLHDVTTMLEAERARIEGAPKGKVASFSGTGSWHVIKEDVSVIVAPMKDQRVALVVLDKVPT